MAVAVSPQRSHTECSSHFRFKPRPGWVAVEPAEAEPEATEQLPLVEQVAEPELAEGEQLLPVQGAERPQLAEAEFIALASNKETSRPALQATSGTSSA
jgi:hypothetical protein